MDRFTKKIADVVLYTGPGVQYPDTGDTPAEMRPQEIRKALARLAAYEDTGMDPDEINDLREFCESQTSTTLAHIYELVQAEREGRLVVTHITEKTMQALECMATQAHSGIEGRAPAKEGRL